MSEPRWMAEHREQHARPVMGCGDCIAIASHRPQKEREVDREARRQRERQRTIDAHTAIEKGVHPYTRRPLLGSETCGSCGHFVEIYKGNRYFKCSHPMMPEPTNGPATDIRKTWPACDWWVSEDAQAVSFGTTLGDPS